MALRIDAGPGAFLKGEDVPTPRRSAALLMVRGLPARCSSMAASHSASPAPSIAARTPTSASGMESPPSLPPARSGGAELDRFVRRHGLLASGGAAVLGS